MKYKLPKSMRDKKRYIEFRAIHDSPISEEDMRRALWGGLLELIGELGAARSLAWLMEWDEERNIGVIRCAIPSVDEVIISLKMVRELNNAPVCFVAEGVSGTMKSLRTTPHIK